VQLGGLNIEDPLFSIRRCTAGLLDYEGQRASLVQEPQFSALVFSIGWISEQAPAEEIAVKISDQ
jgi:hypothetical protein